MSQTGLISISFYPAIEFPSYLKKNKKRNLQSLIDYLNDEYGQLHDFKSYDCDDDSDEGCA